MPYCVQCGVELESGADRCPLCLTPVLLPAAGARAGSRAEAGIEAPGRGSSPGSRPGAGSLDLAPPPKPEDSVERAIAALDPEDKLTRDEGRTLLWELLSVSLGIAALALLVIDLLERPGLSWSRYPLASIALAWILVSLLPRRGAVTTLPALRAIAAALALPGFLLVIDSFEGGLGWSLAIAVPICLSAELISGLAGLAIARTRRRGANVAAILLAAIAALCLAIETILDLSLGRTIRLAWSAIVLSSLLPVSAFLFYLHYRILGKKSLRRFFRL